MDLKCNIQVFAGGVLIPYIIGVDIKNDSQHVGSDCTITMPLNAYTKKYGQTTNTLVTNFKSGIQIEVYAWYDSYSKQKLFMEPQHHTICVQRQTKKACQCTQIIK